MKKQLLSILISFILVIGFSSASYAQGTVTGKVIDQETGYPLVGVAIKIVGQNKGAIADDNGYFELKVSGKTELEIAYLGYEKQTITVEVADGKTKHLGKIRLKPTSFGLSGVSVIADRAKERETPVAISNVDAKQLKLQLGSRDLPLVMNNTPSVYATAQGGGSGDARINVRGFNQRNVAIMINGVPVNDMENGWVYWSNWDGIADATSSIQMQRGLSAVNLATPSIGGTMNIITSPAEMKAGVIGKFEVGSGGFMKSTITGHSGLINSKYAVSAAVVRKVGNGVVDGTWTDAWAYYLGGSYNINKNHRLELYVVGAPQRHGQNLYKQNAATYSHDFAKQIGADSATVKFVEQGSGRLYNQNWAPIDESYKGQQSWEGKTKDRYSSNFINERENFYHKPIVNLNWYAQWSKKLSQFTTAYWSGGKGGGTGTYGAVYRRDANGKLGDQNYKFYYGQSPWGWDWNAQVNAQTSAADTIWVDKKPHARQDGESVGILRNSNNNQSTWGAITKFKYVATEKLKFQVGLDGRLATIDHFRDVRDLLGGQYITFTGNQFDGANDYHKTLGDKIDYYNTNTVKWIGGYIQGEYNTKKISISATYGYSTIKYSYTNHFKTADTIAGGAPDVNSGELTSESAWISGQQIKGGVSYRPTKGLSIYGNVGFVSKVPIFDNVINDRDGTVASSPANEKFQAYEAGVLYSTADHKLDIKANYYYTLWKDRALSKSVTNLDGTEGLVFLSGMNQKHTGFEFEARYRIIKQLGIGGIGSFGNWVYTDDVSGEYKNYNPDTTIKYNYYVSGLKVGDAPQSQIAGWIDIYPIKGLTMQIIYRYNYNFYADWDPFTRTDPTDKEQVWQIPAFGLMDLHLSYQIPLKGRVGLQIFGHVFNVLNNMYVSDAVDNSKYNSYMGSGGNKGGLSHTANAAEVFIGLPTTFNAGVRITFR